MNKEKFIENIRQQFVDPDEVILEMESDFRQNEAYDSLTGMTIMVMLKDEYDVNVTEEDYRSIKTVQELYDYIVAKK